MKRAAKNPTRGEKPNDDDDGPWTIADACSAVTIADVPKIFPDHVARPSKAQKNCVTYLAADGGRVTSQGEVHVVHAADGGPPCRFRLSQLPSPCTSGFNQAPGPHRMRRQLLEGRKRD